jgi:hypothetical protein
LQVAFVVSEFNPNILEWLVGDPLVDRVYHLHLPMLLAVHDPFRNAESIATSRLANAGAERTRYERWLGLGTRLFDLSQLFEDVERLKPDTEATDLPDEGVDMDADADLDEDSGLL